MIAVFVSFSGPGGPDRERAEKVAHEARGTFEGMAGLRSKAFTYDGDARRATNVYLWEDEQAARSFFSEDLRQRVSALYGVESEITFADVLELVDNSAG